MTGRPSCALFPVDAGGGAEAGGTFEPCRVSLASAGPPKRERSCRDCLREGAAASRCGECG